MVYSGGSRIYQWGRLLFDIIFPENCMKMKKFWSGEVSLALFRSAKYWVPKFFLKNITKEVFLPDLVSSVSSVSYFGLEEWDSNTIVLLAELIW